MFQIQHPKIRARCLTHAFENEASIQPQNRNVLTLLRSVLQHFSCTSLNSPRMDTEYYRITPPAPSGILVKPLVEPLETLSHACECTRNKLREALKRDAPENNLHKVHGKKGASIIEPGLYSFDENPLSAGINAAINGGTASNEIYDCQGC
ncbi:hypothetical protein APICC_02921 [Apis cerana cerana]|uniref:Uncharacterized protein n=1 Tax=Apis cerana cerana TaxID=94128 RepID=A0A2A3EEA6_APICC|nr:hypothetical protein APICC_02921 [Apis cerana cerana]